MNLIGKYKDVPTQDLVLMLREIITLTPEDTEEIAEIQGELKTRKPDKAKE